MPAEKPHLVPANLIGQRFPSDSFAGTKIALIGYCPPPAILEQYNSTPTTNQYFIHVPPASVKLISHAGRQFLSFVHVYGGPVSASTVEELAYYDFDYIFAYGLAGSLGTKALAMGDFYIVDSAVPGDGTTPHYTREKLVSADHDLCSQVSEMWSGIMPVRAFTGDAIYREDTELLRYAGEQACDIINLDSAHLFAASRVNDEGKHIRAIQCGVISDIMGIGEGKRWESNLSAMLGPGGTGAIDPLDRTGQIVRFYIERLAHNLK